MAIGTIAMELKQRQELVQAFQKALADRSADRSGKPNVDYMLGYMIQMLQDLAGDSELVADRIRGHEQLLREKITISIT
jgi:hypothetical protein